MTSSWLLSQRKQNPAWDVSNFGDINNSLGGLEDHYIINGAVNECRAGFEAIPIGNPYGFMVCKKQKYENGEGLDVVQNSEDLSRYNGYHKNSVDLYRPWRETPIQMTNPDYYSDRKTPNQSYLHQFDYLEREVRYRGDGIKTHYPRGSKNYEKHGFSYSENPPYKYDVTQLHQKYPRWKAVQIYDGMSQEEADEIDRTFHDSVTASTW
jgi:hypothetical protein